jgi:RND family efflux transporter MFP subunit
MVYESSFRTRLALTRRQAAAVAFALLSGAALAQGVTVPTLVVGAASAAGGFELDGRIEAVRQSTVAAQVSGNLVQLAVKAGDRVAAGQLLARIDERDVQAGLVRGDAAVAQADAEWRNAKLNAERTRELRRQNFVSQAAVDVAETQLEAARAGLDQARAARGQAALARGFASVAAPFAGIVLATHAEVGDLAAAGRPIVTLYAPGEMRATVPVSASRSAAARAARQVEVGLADGRWVVPARRAEMPGTDAVSQTVEWRLDLPPSALAGVQPGQSVRVRFTGLAEGPARMTVPASAVLRRGELTAVYAAQEKGFVLKAVRLGADRGAAGVEILAGLRAGERIAVDAVRAGLAGAAVAP